MAEPRETPATPSTPSPTSGRPRRTGDEAPYTSEAFEVSPEVGTDSPLGAESTDHVDGDDASSR